MMAEGGDTPTAILLNAAAALRTQMFDDISYRALGDAVGVSERTVYRHFPTRSHLLEALAAWIEPREFPLRSFVTIAQFREASRERFRAFDSSPASAFVCARAAMLSPIDEAQPSFATRALEAMLAENHPSVNNRDRRRAAATLRYFASVQFWVRMRTGFDMGVPQIAEVFDRTIDAALRDLLFREDGAPGRLQDGPSV